MYLAAGKSPHCNGGLYCSDKESSKVTNVLENMTDNCREIKKVAGFRGTIVFTDVGARQVKWYNPSTKKVETLAGDGSDGAQDGTCKSCSFVQVHGIAVLQIHFSQRMLLQGKLSLRRLCQEQQTF